MSFITRFFKKSETDEEILEALAADIHKRQTRLSELRLRERRFTLQVTLITLSLWVLYVGLWYGGVWPVAPPYGTAGLQKAVRGVPVLVGPIIILFSRRIVQVWYSRKGGAEEKQLRDVMKKQRQKVEEIKKKTNYYSTRSLLEKYDDFSPAARPGQPPRHMAPGQQQIQQPTTPQAPGGLKKRTPAQSIQTPQNGSGKVNPPLQISPTPQPIRPVRKQWYDKVADVILGDDASAEGPASSRYALICEKCFMHNGLVKESMWQDAQYVCPKCGHFNPSPRSRSQGADVRRSHSPSSPPGMSVPLPPSRSLRPTNGAIPSVPVAPAAGISAAGTRSDARADGEGPDPDHTPGENLEVDRQSR